MSDAGDEQWKTLRRDVGPHNTTDEGAFNRPARYPAPLLDPDAEPVEPAPNLAAEMESGRGVLSGHEPTVYMMPPLLGQQATQVIPNYGFPPQGPAPAAGPYWAGAPDSNRHDDDFSIADAYYDLIETLAAPRDFFAAQVGREGCRAPLSMLAAYTLGLAFGLLVVLFTFGSHLGPTGMILVLLLPFGLLLLYAALTTVAVGAAAALYVIVSLFWGGASFAGSFRAFVYASAPVCTATALALALSPLQQHATPVARVVAALPSVLGVLAPIWSVILLGIALHHVHRLSLRAVITVMMLFTALCIGCGYALSLLPISG